MDTQMDTSCVPRTQLLRDRISALETALHSEQNEHAEAKQRIRRLIEFAPEAIVMFDAQSGRFIDANPNAERMFGMLQDELLKVGPFDLSPPEQPVGDSRAFGEKKIVEAINGGAPVFDWWHCNARGERFPCEVRLVRMPWKGRQVLRATITDISERKQLEMCETGRCQVLENIALGVPLGESLEKLVRIIEGILAGMACSVLLLDQKSNRLYLGAAPSLPSFYNDAIEGVKIGPTIGSCGAAAYSGQRVIAGDVMGHPNWASFRDLAEQANLRACWSEPIISLKGNVLGTFAIYYREPREPVPVELRVIEIAARVAAVAIEHDQTQRWQKQVNEWLQQRVDEKTRELEESNKALKQAEQDLNLAAVSFEAHDSILITDRDGRILRVNDSFTKLTGYTAAEVIGKTPNILKSGRHEEEFYAQMWNAIRQQSYWEGEIWNKRKDGHIFPQRLTITSVKDESGDVTHFIAAGQDITNEKQVAADRASISVARKVQQNLFPSEVPQFVGLDMAGKVFPAESVSGDYFDFISMRHNHVGVVVADVSGHGLGPAMLMAETQAYLRALAEIYFEPGEILTQANRLLFAQSGQERFVTLFLARLDPATRSFVYASAGQQGYRLDYDGNIHTLESTGVPLGVLDDAAIETSPAVSLNPGDILFLPTDGIEESLRPDDEVFGRQKMFDVIKSNRVRPASEIICTLYDDVREFAQGAPQKDDITTVVVKALE